MKKNLEAIFIKEKVIKAIREFFDKKGFHEVEIPVLSTSIPIEQNIYSFKTVWQTIKGRKNLYLSTSPEAFLKKMIAKGIGNCYGLGHTFRNLESAGKLHSPEFLMLEWYRENADYKDIMKECEEMISFIVLSLRGAKRRGNLSKMRDKSRTSRELLHFVQNDDWERKWSILSMEDLFAKYAKLDLEELCLYETKSHPGKSRFHRGASRIPWGFWTSQNDIFTKYDMKDAKWEQLFNQIFLNEIEPHLPKDPFFLIDYPARISPLCAKRRDKPYLAERFELYINGIEIANGNTENTDVDEVLQSFKEEKKQREKRGIETPPIDMKFIDALRKMHGKSYAGVGLGIERLVMVLGGMRDINQLD